MFSFFCCLSPFECPNLSWSRSDYHKSFFSYVNTSLASNCLSLSHTTFLAVCVATFAEGSYVITPKVHEKKMPLLWLSTSSALFGAMYLVWGLQIKEYAAKLDRIQRKTVRLTRVEKQV